MTSDTLARMLVTLGILLVLAGGLVYLLGRFDVQLGRLPGDFRIERENFRLYIPLGTSILISLLLTIVLSLLSRFLNR